MKLSRWMMMACALAMMLGVFLSAAPAHAQQPGGAISPDAEPPPPTNRGRTSAEFINWQLGSGMLRLQRALAMQTNGTTPDPEQTSKTIYEGYVKIRSAHALLMRRIETLHAKTKVPDPLLAMAFKTIRKARFSVLYARQAAAKSQTERSVDYLTNAISELERARAAIN
jgi:hypothetical protein